MTVLLSLTRLLCSRFCPKICYGSPIEVNGCGKYVCIAQPCFTVIAKKGEVLRCDKCDILHSGCWLSQLLYLAGSSERLGAQLAFPPSPSPTLILPLEHPYSHRDSITDVFIPPSSSQGNRSKQMHRFGLKWI